MDPVSPRRWRVGSQAREHPQRQMRSVESPADSREYHPGEDFGVGDPFRPCHSRGSTRACGGGPDLARRKRVKRLEDLRLDHERPELRASSFHGRLRVRATLALQPTKPALGQSQRGTSLVVAESLRHGFVQGESLSIGRNVELQQRCPLRVNERSAGHGPHGGVFREQTTHRFEVDVRRGRGFNDDRLTAKGIRPSPRKDFARGEERRAERFDRFRGPHRAPFVRDMGSCDEVDGGGSGDFGGHQADVLAWRSRCKRPTHKRRRRIPPPTGGY